MNSEYHPEVSIKPWGPFISPNYVNERITKADVVVASIVWALTLVNVIIGCWLAIAQTKHSRSPLRSVYVWMIWLELMASFIMGLECILHLLKHIPPSESFDTVSGQASHADISQASISTFLSVSSPAFHECEKSQV
jgi:hypothetical protein